ncbi:MAG: ATP-dependent DNA helicase RecG [Clostridia bacterium]|nr:ATP-dependent DNA helicase RecG [Clostridia bacterium]
MQQPVLQKEICYLKGVGPAKAKLLQKLGIETVGDLIACYPRDYRDLTVHTPIAAAPFDETCCIKATVTTPAVERRLSGGRTLYTLTAFDGQTEFRVLFFNTKYAAQALRRGETYLFYGKVSGSLLKRELVSPTVYTVEQASSLLPVYPLTAGISNKVMNTLVKNAFATLSEPLGDPLPQNLRIAHRLMGLDEAVKAVHFPKNREEMLQARRRLIFEELFLLQLALRRLKGRSRGVSSLTVQRDFTPEFWQSLPFTPTAAQRRVTDECFGDLQSGVPMNRLVQGDVGSGKTAVAAALCHSVALNRLQCAVMAPTEILAQQHYETFTKFLAPFGIRTGLLTGSTKAAEKRQFLADLADGTLQVAIGTHALLEDAVQFCSLGLVVTDEQHRFGVAQRSRLAAKGQDPHLLVMSATPIPRTLALIIYGDLDVSVINELPPGRKQVATYAVPTSYRPRVYEYIRKFLSEGQQAYVVCPLVEESEENPSPLTAAVDYQKQLQQEFPDHQVGLLHGKMRPKEKEQIMSRFAAGQIHILVATTVIEVGVDVPAANIMVIENAERFGLSQLHQLRGRVGRGDHAAATVLISDAKGEIAAKRLQVLKETNDGFRIADEDLKLRGPGDFFGARQHGLPPMKLADLLTDTKELTAAAAAADTLLRTDPALGKAEHAGIRREVERLMARVGQG